MRIPALTALVAALAAPISKASDYTNEKAAAVATIAQQRTNTLASFTSTTITSVEGKKEVYTFHVTSDRPVLRAEKTKAAWLIVAVAALGDELNKNSYLETDVAWFSDQEVRYVLSSAAIRDFQGKVEANEITLEEFYAQITRFLIKSEQ